MRQSLPVLLLGLAIASEAADSVTIMHMPGNAPGVTYGKRVLARVDGRQFEAIRKDVEKIAASIGTRPAWSDWGPDAEYLSAEINLGGKKYTIDSWYPLHKDDETIAVSEKRGLVSVSGKKEKERIEGQNSERYRTLVGIFDVCGRTSPRPAHAGDGNTRAR
jgi:hypothetical protein